MPLFRHGKHPRPGYYDKEGKFVTDDIPVTATVKTHTVHANAGGTGGGGGSFGVGNGLGAGSNGAGAYGSGGQGGGGFSGGSSSATQDRYNPVRERLDEGSVLEDWIPRDAAGLDRMFRLMYHRDTAGIVVDLIAEVIWDEMDITGIDDPAIKKIYSDCLNELDPATFGPLITREFLVLGKNVSSLIFDPTRGIFRDIASHDPDFLRITPIPIKGFDPKVDLIASPAMREFVHSEDPRDIDARGVLPEVFLKAIQAGSGPGLSSMKMQQNRSQGSQVGAGIPLDPLNTMYLARSVFPYDRVGTSLFTRLIPFYALEMALINATLTSARRRSRSILHVTMGQDNIWEPSAAEMNDIAGMFIQADDDPVGAVVGTRTGVTVNEVRDGANFYKWSDEWQLLNEGKMRALGVSDALLSGDATYSNQEDARMFFMQRAKVLQTYMVSRIFYNKLFPLLARIHNFTRKPKANVHNGIIMGSEKLTQREALKIPDSELILPKLKFRTDLVSNIDKAKLELYEKMEERNVPITLKNWTNAAGLDLQAQIADLDNDAALRKRVAQWKQETDNAIQADEEVAKLEFVKSLQGLTKENIQKVTGSSNTGSLSEFVFWDERAEIATVKAADVLAFVDDIDPSSNKVHILIDPIVLQARLASKFGNGKDIAHYILYRTGLTPVKPILSPDNQQTLGNYIKNALDKYAAHGNVYQLGLHAQQEIKIITSLGKMHREKEMADMEKSIMKHSTDPLRNKSSRLYSGVGK